MGMLCSELLLRKLHAFWNLLRDAWIEWNRDNAMRLSAMLAFYTVFSFAPILILFVAAASFFFGREDVRSEVIAQLEGALSPSSAIMVQTILQNARQASVTATLIGLIAALFGATMVFVALQEALNTIWGVTVKSGNVLKHFFRKRLISFVMLLAVGTILLISTIAGAALVFAGSHMEGKYFHAWILDLAQFVTSVLLAAILFGVIFKVLPDVKIEWADVWIGALVTSLLFNLGRMFIGMYLARSIVGSLYGAAGSFAIFLIWIYYSAQVFFFGAEFTQVCARKRGTPIAPDKHAVAFKIEHCPKSDESRTLQN